MTIIDNQKKNAICILMEKLSSMTEKWAITGSFGLALQGVNINPNDIDIITSQNGVFVIQLLCADYIKSKVEYLTTTTMRSYFGVMEIDSCAIEFFGEIENFLENNYWDYHKQWDRNIIEIEIEELQIPVLKLEYELHIYKKLWMSERADLIARKLQFLNENLQ